IDLVEGGRLAQLPTLITGDFNSTTHFRSAYRALVTDGPFADTWETAAEQLTPAWGTFPDYQEPVEGGERIDWVLATEEFTVHRAAIDASTDHRAAPSAHAPVQAQIGRAHV